MIVVEELLQPISEDRPSGSYLRSDPVYDSLKEARREAEASADGDYSRVISLATTALKEQTKDLQIAAWLTEALYRQEGFAGLATGLQLLRGLLDKFWDTVYPEAEDGDLEFRTSPLDWIGWRFANDIRKSAIDKSAEATADYYADLEARLHDCLAALESLTALCDAKFGADTPNFVKLQEALTEVHFVASSLRAAKS